MSEDYWIGRTLGRRYEIRTLLGRGGMSAVYGGYDPNLNREVAIKLIHKHLSDNPEFVRRFQEEASAVAKFRHPHIVQVYDFNNDDETYYIIFELVHGETLQELLQKIHARGDFLTQARAAEIAAQVADALQYAHSRGIVHRDIKPGNVMINQDDNVILTDFGLAKILGGTQHTAAGAVLGTMRYISPEQIKSAPIDGRSDIYSLGVMLYEMVANQPPFDADSAMSLMMKHLTNPVPPLYALRPDVSPDLVDIIDKAMAKEPDDRFQTAGAMAQALRKLEGTFLSAESGLAIAGLAGAATVILPDSTPVTPSTPETRAESVPLAATEITAAEVVVSAENPTKPSTPKTEQTSSATPPQKRSRRGLLIGALLLLAIVAIGALFMSGVFDRLAAEPEVAAIAQPGDAANGATIPDTPTAEPAPTDEPVAAIITDQPEPTATDKPAPTNTPRSTNTPTPTIDLLADAVEFVDEDYGISILIPPDWSSSDEAERGTFMFASDLALLDVDTTYADGLYLETITTANSDALQSGELVDWLNNYITAVFDEETFNTQMISEAERIELEDSDVEAAQARFSADFNLDGVDDDILLTSLLKDEQLVLLFAISSAENIDQWTELHTAIVNSIQLDGNAPIAVAADADNSSIASNLASGPVVAAGSGLPLDFEGSGSWAVGTQKNGTLTLTSANPYAGSKSGEINYAFESDGSDFVIFLQENSVSSSSNALCLRVFGTGDSNQRHYLNAWIRDADGQSWQIPFGQVGHSGWLEMVANFDGARDWPFRAVDESIKDINGKITYPITFRGLAIDDAPDTFNGTGTIYVDNLRSCSATTTSGSTTPTAATPSATAPVTTTTPIATTPISATPLALSVSNRSIQSNPEQPELYNITIFLTASGGSGNYVYYFDNLATTATPDPQLTYAARCGNDAPHSIQVEDADGNRVSINYTVSRTDLPCG